MSPSAAAPSDSPEAHTAASLGAAGDATRPSMTQHARIAAGTTIAGLDPAELVAAHGSPLFIYDLDVLSARVAALRAVLPPAAEVAFAVKANPSLAVLAHLARLDVGGDVASGGELTAAVRAGIPIDRIIFTGPGKTDAELGRALRLGVRAVTVESLEELDVLIELRELAHIRQGLLLRLAVSSGREETPIISGPGAAKFGLTADEVDEAIDRLHRVGAAGGPGAPFEVLGLHAFGASNVREADHLIDGVRELAARAESVAARHGTPIRLLDAGGGLGIPYADGDAPLDLHRFGHGLTAELDTWAGRRGLAGGRLLLEPGRFLVGPMGAYLVRVTRTKPRAGRTIAVVDGGIHHLIRPALIGQGQRIVAVGEAAGRPATATVDVVGPLCTGLDVLAVGAAVPAPQAGDLLAVLDTGAYGFSESMPLFLSHPQPAEVVVSAGRASVARLRRDPEHVLAGQLIPHR
jgi:diaminopimelate decarboxylase